MMANRQTLPVRGSGPAVCLCLLLAGVAGGCEAEAIELAREIEAARGECTAERLRTSDEECVRMMERYAGITADLIDTYIGGVRSLDIALDRMPPMAFDTGGLGYAISPEYRVGDPLGEGASPRLSPTNGFASRAPAHAQLREGSWRGGVAPLMSDREAHVRGGGVTGVSPLPGRARIDERFGYDRYGRGRLPFAGEFRYDIFDSGPYGYFSNPWGGYGHTPYGYGYDYEYELYGYGPYDYRWPYTRGYYGYDRYPGRYPDYGSGLYARGEYYRDDGRWSEPLYDRGYASPDPYGRPYADGYYEYRQGRPEPDLRTPAEDWGYEPEVDMDAQGLDGGADASTQNRVGPAPARPPRHRPGILLPPEERLRRPWLED